jgi:autotransporter-associated beta strand protein
MSLSAKSRLLATSAVAGLCVWQTHLPAAAEDAFGIHVDTPEGQVIVIENGEIVEGDRIGVYAEQGALDLTVEAGARVRGNGSYDGFGAPPDAGITIATAGSSVDNSGSISGAGAGITTAYVYDSATDTLVGQAIGTVVVNSGTIAGDSNDGVRLIGGGSVTNSGTILGANWDFADGISMYAYADQANEDYSALVTNEAGGEIAGQRFGVILSGGGDVVNDGDITGVVGGVLIQGTALDSEERSGLTASVVNSGTISGTGSFGGTYTDGQGVAFGSDMAAATLVNSGTITSAFAEAVSQGSLANLTITNEQSGVIEGGTSGIYGGSSGTMSIINAGTIRGNGSYDGFGAPPDAGITIATAGSSVDNSGSISGAGAGITTAYVYDSATDTLVGQAIGTVVVNSGTIAGDSNDGVRLIGGGSVTNSGTILGANWDFADGISMYAYADQANEDYSALVTNEAGGEIAGQRFGVILSGGGDVVNDGDITGVVGGVLIQGTALDSEERSGLTASVVNSGTISGTGSLASGVAFGSDMAAATLVNSGTINGAAAGIEAYFSGAFSLANTGTVTGGGIGVDSGALGAVTLNNSGSITGESGPAVASASQTTLINSGALHGAGGVAVQLAEFDDSVTLRTGSSVVGTIDAGDGADILTLEGDVLELTSAQVIGGAKNFETLRVAAGYWSTASYVGGFDQVAIVEGASLQVNEVTVDAQFTSPILTANVLNDGKLVLNFDHVEIDELAISGSGGVTLIGEAVYEVTDNSLTYTGDTIIANGGVILTGSLDSDVETQGDGFFTLGTGGTEGTYVGSIVNNGVFNFDRSDNYEFLGDFSGSGTLNKFGAGTLTFSGLYDFGGTTTINAGAIAFAGQLAEDTQLDLSDGGTFDLSQIQSGEQTIAELSGTGGTLLLGDTDLTVQQTADSVFAGAITGTGTLLKDGSGDLKLNGDGTGFIGTGQVDGGTLSLNGDFSNANFLVNDGGTLGGAGTLGSTTVSGGTLAPGNSIDTITFAGDLTLTAASVYEVEVDPAGNSDRTNVTGTATLGNATVNVLAESGLYGPATDYTILTAENGISGQFGEVQTNLAYLVPLLSYTVDTVSLRLSRNDIDFSTYAATPNQATVGALIEGLEFGTPLYDATLVLARDRVAANFETLTGGVYPTYGASLVETAYMLRRQAAPQPQAAVGAFVWGTGLAGELSASGGDGVTGFKTDNTGAAGGLGYAAAGFDFAVGLGKLWQDPDRSQISDSDVKFALAQASYASPIGLSARAGVQFGWIDGAASRNTRLGTISATVSSAFEGEYTSYYGEIGYALPMGVASIEPFAGLNHVSLDMDRFTEVGGATALTVDRLDRDVTFADFGLRLAANPVGGVAPYLSGAYRRAWGDRMSNATIAFAGNAGGGTITGLPIARSAAEVEAGVRYSGGVVDLELGYTGSFSKTFDSNSVKVSASIHF